MPETTPLIKAALNLRVGAGFDVYVFIHGKDAQNIQRRILKGHSDIFLGCSFAIPPFLIYELIIR